MAANQFGIDLGEIYRNKEAIEGGRTRNKLASLQLGEVEREISQRPAREAEALKQKNMLAGFRQKAVGGDVDAQRQLLALDPEGGASFIDAISKMDETKRKSVQRTVDEMGQMSGYVLQGKTPEEQQRRYSLMYKGVSPEVQAKLPEAFDPQFMEMSLSKAMAMDKILENPKAIRVGGEDVIYKGGREIERKAVPLKESESGTGFGGGLKSGDESLMYRQAAELLGGMFDQAGNLQALDPETRTKAQAIATEATNLFRNGGITRTQAVADAAKKFGIEMPGQMSDNDPLGLR